MTGLREEKKHQNQMRIIKEAEKSFSEIGYQETKMADIAKEAKVGTGTIYNYYPSKGTLLLAVFESEFVRLKRDKNIDFSLEGEDVVREIIKFLKIFMSFFTEFPKSFWKEIIHVMTADADESIGIRRGLFGLDEEMMTHLKITIDNYTDCFKVPVDSNQATQAIYSTVMMQAMLFIYDEKMTYEQLIRQINQQVEFIFIGKL